MIVPSQQNVKVHFAGAENPVRVRLIHDVTGINYSLFTIFPFLCEKFGIKHGYQQGDSTYPEIADLNVNLSRHSIMDSGLFSLMFGSFQADRDIAFIERWYETLVETVKAGGYTGTCVEVDCQKVLGVAQAWQFRERMRRDLPNNRQINVFHKEDGQAGLDRLIEFTDYIAISVPELRALGRKKDARAIAHYIKNKKPSIDIHLLGCTENKMLRELSFCTSADSTSWTSFNKYGHFKFNDGKKTHAIRKDTIRREVLIEKYGERVAKAITDSRRKATDSLLYYHCCDAMQLEYLLKQYTIYAGPQN